MNPKLAAIRDKLDRAEEHIHAVHEIVRDYFASDLCRFSGEYDAQTQQTTFRRSIQMPPIRLATLAGEVVHNLRSSLDHLAWLLVTENGGTPTEQTYWPVQLTPPTPNSSGVMPQPVVAGGVSNDALAIIERSQPYWQGFGAEHHPLWILHRLSVIDKHRHIPIHGVLPAHPYFAGTAPYPSFTWSSELVRADEYSAELRLVPNQTEVDVEGRVSLYVVVPEPPGHEASLSTTLGLARDEIHLIVEETEAMCL